MKPLLSSFSKTGLWTGNDVMTLGNRREMKNREHRRKQREKPKRQSDIGLKKMQHMWKPTRISSRPSFHEAP